VRLEDFEAEYCGTTHTEFDGSPLSQMGAIRGVSSKQFPAFRLPEAITTRKDPSGSNEATKKGGPILPSGRASRQSNDATALQRSAMNNIDPPLP